MAKTFMEAILLFNKVANFEITDLSMENNEPTIHYINHKFREEVIIPFIQVSSNISFCIGRGEKTIITSDKVECRCVDWKEIHLCELEDDIQRLYGIDPWSFLKRWYGANKSMQSMFFLKIKLQKK